MKKQANLLKRPEVIVAAAIAVFVIAASLLVNIPQMQKSSLPNLGTAPELAGISGWINSQPVNISSLKGKVVLVDFWTYTCINCIRTLPYVNDWQAKYDGNGLIIIGVHTPEFEFEKDRNNVLNAVSKYGIKYAVAQDNDYATWRAYKNQYWPRHYLIDKDGNIRYDHIGEGGYDETEKAIQQLLTEAGYAAKANMTPAGSGTDFSQIGTPELYLGYNFARADLGNPEGFVPGQIVDYKETNVTSGNVVYLSGKWRNDADKITAINNSKLFLVYRAKNVNIVAGDISTISVKIEGFPTPENFLGSDAASGGIVKVNEQRLYNIVSAPDYGTYMLEIDAQPGFSLYTFTFG